MTLFSTILVGLLVIIAVQTAFGDTNLIILHTNDVHDRFEQFEELNGGKCDPKKKCFGGASRRMTKINEIRKKNKNVLLLDGGDQYSGTLWFTTYGGKAAAYFNSRLGYDAMALGNHEFDSGVEGLVTLMKSKKFPIVCCNIDVSGEPRLWNYIKKSIILDINGLKVGIIGYLTPHTKFMSNAGNTVSFSDEIPAIKIEVDSLKSQGIGFIIAVGHSGFEQDLKIAREVSGVDIVVGGHTDTFLYNGKVPSTEKSEGPYPYVITKKCGSKVYVVQDYTYGKYLGYLEVTLNDAGVLKEVGGNPILLDSTVPQEPAMEKEIQVWAKKVLETEKKKVGFSRVYLDGDRRICRTRECNLGNLIADSMVYPNLGESSEKSWANCTMAMMDSGSIRASVVQGTVELGDLLKVDPYRNTLFKVTLSGREIVKVLEHSVENLKPGSAWPNGRFMQVSGIRVAYDLSKIPGQRVQTVQVLCSKCQYPIYEGISLCRKYNVIVNSFIASGGEEFKWFINATKIDTGFTDVDVLSNYVAKFSPIMIGLEDRIKFIGISP